ncbi:MAG: crossover junction endodeoxyribonuclease RuvC [Terriglobia bacterium]|jgi:crossover junction endodeoxyribonuclease RuvC
MASTPQEPTRVIGIDPGLNITGYGVVVSHGSDVKLVEAGLIRLPPSHGQNLPARLEALFRELQQVMKEFSPQAMCLEEVYSHADYPRTAILMGHARGVICLAARLEGIPVLSFSAKRVKQSVTGNGNASKSQVQRAVQNFFSLTSVPHPPDVADALAVALCYVNAMRFRDSGHGERRNSKLETGKS